MTNPEFVFFIAGFFAGAGAVVGFLWWIDWQVKP